VVERDMNNGPNLRSSKTTNKKRRRLKKSVRQFLLICIPLIFIIVVGSVILNNLSSKEAAVGTAEQNKNENKDPSQKGNSKENEAEVPKQEPVKDTSITISAAGDFTIGTDETFTYSGSFVDEAEKNDLPYFIEGIKGIFQADDFTTVNLETTLTTSAQKAQKKFRFKGDPTYAQIFTLGGIEAVNLANNHIHDYLQQGYDDTLVSLEKQNIGYFGYDQQYVTKVKNVKIGALGYEGWNDSPEIRSQVKKDIKSLRDQGVQIILVHYHWGVERQYVPTEAQKTLARYTIDAGADLILGHHPHVVQGIEEYNGKFIVYSLGNFMFGGNRNPSDKDTYVFQQTFHLKNDVLTDQKEINVIPFSISSVTNRNNYQPVPLEGAEADRVMQKIIDSSDQINGSKWIVYDSE
jgi:poly-gamma-glutamate capsule biosynthesis protein CapA/YwtB (metallophosphatase superfamily)